MKILNNQSLSYKHLISYKCNVPLNEIIRLIDYMCSNLSVLNNTIAGAPLMTKNGTDQNKPFEILLPIQENRTDVQPEFKYKHNFSISNALSIRYTGNTYNIDKAEQKLNNYLTENSYTAESPFYYSVVKIDKENYDKNIIDIYVKVKCQKSE